MDWTELCITVATADTEIAAGIIQMVAGGGIYIEDYSDLKEQALAIARIDLFDEALLQKDSTKSIIHIYLPPEVLPAEHIAFIGGRLTACEIPFTVGTSKVRELDWSTAWKQYYHPIELSPRVAICPTWEDYTPKENQQVIRLDPGMAFGTGTHETTQLCLGLLEKHLPAGGSMLDIGCGSGILAICAKLLGAQRTVGVDIDPVAVKTATENCAENHCAVELVCGDLAQQVTGQFELICANIVADAIIRLCPNVPALLASGGVFVASGIIDDRKDEVCDALTACGLPPFEIVEQRGWVALACRQEG